MGHVDRNIVCCTLDLTDVRDMMGLRFYQCCDQNGEIVIFFGVLWLLLDLKLTLLSVDMDTIFKIFAE